MFWLGGSLWGKVLLRKDLPTVSSEHALAVVKGQV